MKNIVVILLLLTTFSQIAASQTPFITQWDLSQVGASTDGLSFGVTTSGDVSYTWQEVAPGTASGSGTFSGSLLSITGLPTGKTINLSIFPTNFQSIKINNSSDRLRLVNVLQWGSVNWTSME